MRNSATAAPWLVLITMATTPVSMLRAQPSPFVPEALARDLVNELSGDRAFEYVRWLSHYHRIMGSQGFLDAARWIAGKAEAFGLENVHIEEQPFIGRPSWDLLSGEMWIIEPEEIKIADFESQPVSIAVFSRSAHLEAELVDIGAARPADFAGTEVTGKVVLTTAPPAIAIPSAVWEGGALGVVSSASIRPHPEINTPDQVAYMKVPAESPDGKPGPWAAMISPRRYVELRDMLAEEARNGRAVRVRVAIEAQVREPSRQAYAWAEIRGSEIHDQDIVLTAHLDEERTSANDNGSGCASQLEVARAINVLIAKGRLPRPRRDIVCWWPNEHTSEYEYFKAHPGERRRMLVNINQDMVGARQSMGSRVQHVILTPWSAPTYLNDVVTSVVEYVIKGNNGFMGADEAGGSYPFPAPIFSFRGSREPYHAMIVPHVGSSDQEVFCEGVIGIPGIALINHPDFYIHSSEDDLGNIDPTQLKRNAFVVAAVTLAIASAGDGDVPALAAEVYGRGLERIGRDLRIALQHLKSNASGSLSASARDARNLVRQAAERETKAIASVLVFADPAGRNAEYVRNLLDSMRAKETELLQEVDRMGLLVGEQEKLPDTSLPPQEAAAAAKIPVNIESLDDYFTRRGWSVGAHGALHPVLAKECFSFVDGKRSYLDIYRAVRAEALSAGRFYYGDVILEDVVGLLDAAVEKRVLLLR
ncbi:MAG: M28 family peptidase [Planctomycetota bacterium]